MGISSEDDDEIELLAQVYAMILSWPSPNKKHQTKNISDPNHRSAQDSENAIDTSSNGTTGETHS